MAEVWVFRPEQGGLPRRLFRAADFGSIWLEDTKQLRATVRGADPQEVILARGDRASPDFPELFDWQLVDQIGMNQGASAGAMVLVAQWTEEGFQWIPYDYPAYQRLLHGQEQRETESRAV